MCWEVSDPTAPVFQVTALHVPIYHISLFWEAVTRRLIVDLGGGSTAMWPAWPLRILL